MTVKLFVGGLSLPTSGERLREAFAGAGEAANTAVFRRGGTELDGRQPRVEIAKPAGSGGGRPRGGGGGGRDGWRGDR